MEKVLKQVLTFLLDLTKDEIKALQIRQALIKANLVDIWKDKILIETTKSVEVLAPKEKQE